MADVSAIEENENEKNESATEKCVELRVEEMEENDGTPVFCHLDRKKDGCDVLMEGLRSDFDDFKEEMRRKLFELREHAPDMTRIASKSLQDENISLRNELQYLRNNMRKEIESKNDVIKFLTETLDSRISHAVQTPSQPANRVVPRDSPETRNSFDTPAMPLSQDDPLRNIPFDTSPLEQRTQQYPINSWAPDEWSIVSKNRHSNTNRSSLLNNKCATPPGITVRRSNRFRSLRCEEVDSASRQDVDAYVDLDDASCVSMTNCWRGASASGRSSGVEAWCPLPGQE